MKQSIITTLSIITAVVTVAVITVVIIIDHTKGGFV